MPLIFDIFRSLPSRISSRGKSRVALEAAVLSPQAVRTRWYRSVLTAILACIALGALIEVVVLPGKLVRRHFQPFGFDMGIDTSSFGSEFKLPFGLQTENQKTTKKQQQDDLLQQQVRSGRDKLDQSYQKLLAARDSLQSYCQTKLTVAPDSSAGVTVPPSLVDVIADQPTAQLAWSQLIQTLQVAEDRLRGSHELLETVAVHLSANTFLAQDEKDLISRLDGMNQSLSDLMGSRDYIDHIATLKRARAALNRKPPQDDNPGTPP